MGGTRVELQRVSLACMSVSNNLANARTQGGLGAGDSAW